MTLPTCPGCGRDAPLPQYEVGKVPVHSVKTFHTRESAERADTGRISLSECPGCGLVWNTVFDPENIDYDVDYESTQSASPTFNRFHQTLARDLVKRFDLKGKHVAEIGCGQGEFLSLLHQAGVGRTTGFDPAFRGNSPHPNSSITASALNPSTNMDGADLICCKMTLEHVVNPRTFLSMLSSIAAKHSIPVFLTVPNGEKVFSDGAFWDVYHEHIHYFTRRSLKDMSTAAGLTGIRIESCYDNQYLAVTSNPRDKTQTAIYPGPALRLAGFTARASTGIERWRANIRKAGEKGPIVLWGGGSKAVAFLSTTGAGNSIDAIVDINRARQGTFLPPAGHPIVSPAALKVIDPATIIVMNPIYREEITAALSKLNLTAKILALGSDE